jgi:hypothetical protein
MVRPPALDVLRMAQDVVEGQVFRGEPYQLNVSLIAAADADKRGSASRSA